MTGIKVKAGSLEYTTYLLYKPEIETAAICYNAGRACCRRCQEPECELARG